MTTARARQLMNEMRGEISEELRDLVDSFQRASERARARGVTIVEVRDACVAAIDALPGRGGSVDTGGETDSPSPGRPPSGRPK